MDRMDRMCFSKTPKRKATIRKGIRSSLSWVCCSAGYNSGSGSILTSVSVLRALGALTGSKQIRDFEGAV